MVEDHGHSDSNDILLILYNFNMTDVEEDLEWWMLLIEAKKFKEYLDHPELPRIENLSSNLSITHRIV